MLLVSVIKYYDKRVYMFRKDWVIINLSREICDATIEHWIRISGVPSCFSFSFENDSPIENKLWGDSVWPWGRETWTIVFHDYDDPRFPKGTNNAVGGSSGERCSVAYRSRLDSGIEIGARIWHEMLHSMGSDPDQMEGKDRAEFCDWVSNNRFYINEPFKKDAISWCVGTKVSHKQYQHVLCVYYMMLTNKVNGDCYKKDASKDIREEISRLVYRIISFIRSIFGKV